MRKISVILICFLLAINILKGSRFPNIWSYTHYLFNYHHGFVKRGLIGELIRFINIDYINSYEFFVIISFLIFSISIVLILILSILSLRKNNLYVILALIIYYSSVSTVFLSHTVGYFDHLGLILTLSILIINKFSIKYITAVIGTAICILTHEAFFIIYFPIIFLSLSEDITYKDYKRTILLMLLFLGALLLTYSLSRAILPESIVGESYNQAQIKTTVPLRTDAFQVQSRDGDDNLLIMNKLWGNGKRWASLLLSILTTLPSTIFIYFVTVKFMKANGRSFTLIALATLASFSPLLLHFTGWDMDRFNSLTILTSFLVFIIFTSPSGRIKEPISMNLSFNAVLFFSLLFILNLSTDIRLFDGYKIELFPFINKINYLYDYFLHGKNFIEIPVS